VATVDKPGLTEPIEKCRHPRSVTLRSRGIEKADYRRRCKLRARSERPTSNRAAENRHELAALHTFSDD
ncbi:MAG: hypothetical protein ACREC2_09020, partial [Bradyrhizobium sp.]